MQFETHPSNGVSCLLIILVNKGLDHFFPPKSVVLSDVCEMASLKTGVSLNPPHVSHALEMMHNFYSS